MPKLKIQTFQKFLDEQSENVRVLVEVLDGLFLSYPNVTCKMRYNIPFYDYGKWVCYMNPLKKIDGIELVFLQGLELQKVFPFLQDKKRKMAAGIEITDVGDEVLEKVVIVWEEAISLLNT